MKRFFCTGITLFLIFAATAQSSADVRFETALNSQQIKPDTLYYNEFGEDYRISKLKYYVSNLHFVTDEKTPEESNVFLIDFRNENIFNIPLPKGNIKGIEFLLGVDSILNCSGAQSGALDPLNDMFWTWSSGYVMFKLEATSSIAKTDEHRLEYHIGGYKGQYKTMRKVFLPLKKTGTEPLKKITIEMSPELFWNGKNKFSFAGMPVIVTIGASAERAADNFPGMFSVKE